MLTKKAYSASANVLKRSHRQTLSSTSCAIRVHRSWLSQHCLRSHRPPDTPSDRAGISVISPTGLISRSIRRCSSHLFQRGVSVSRQAKPRHEYVRWRCDDNRCKRTRERRRRATVLARRPDSTRDQNQKSLNAFANTLTNPERPASLVWLPWTSIRGSRYGRLNCVRCARRSTSSSTRFRTASAAARPSATPANSAMARGFDPTVVLTREGRNGTVRVKWGLNFPSFRGARRCTAIFNTLSDS